MMRRLYRVPSHHPAAWLSLAVGLGMLGYLLFTGESGGIGVAGYPLGGALAVLGLAELIPGERTPPLTATLRLLGLVLAAVAILSAVTALLF